MAADLDGGGGAPAGVASLWFYGFLAEFPRSSEQGFIQACGRRQSSAL